jgi:hypothetical protein
VSSTYASRFEINPTGHPEAQALQQWWDQEGCNTTFSPAGMSRICLRSAAGSVATLYRPCLPLTLVGCIDGTCMHAVRAIY